MYEQKQLFSKFLFSKAIWLMCITHPSDKTVPKIQCISCTELNVCDCDFLY